MNSPFSLFDETLSELAHDLSYITQPFTKIPPGYFPADFAEAPVSLESIQIRIPVFVDSMVYYRDSRTGRKACMSASRYCAICALQSGLRKRFIGDTSEASLDDEQRKEKALEEFLEDNARCMLFNANYSISDLPPFVKAVRERCRTFVSRLRIDYDMSTMLTLMSHELAVGPGSSRKVKSEGFYEKLFGGVVSYTSPMVYGIYKLLVNTSGPLWVLGEAVRLNLYGTGDRLTVASFTSVLKTNLTNRGICTQPSLNMTCQLALNFGPLREMLKRYFDCDLVDQQFKNRKLAQIASRGPVVDRETHRVFQIITVDMTRASNFPFCVIRDLFSDTAFLDLIEKLRSPLMDVPSQRGMRLVEKHMCSSMGNGFTFSLMTLYFSMIVSTLYDMASLPQYISVIDPDDGVCRQVKSWAVYGDDIIVDVSVYPALVQVMSSFGCLINKQKTCDVSATARGSYYPVFRESCGADYFDGLNVRPVYCETLRTQTDIYSLLNRLINWGAMHSVDLPRTIAVLRRSLGSDELRVPNWEDVCSGFHVPFHYSIPCTQWKTVNPRGFPKDFKPNGGTFYQYMCPDTRSRSLFHEITRSVQYSDMHTREVYTYQSTIQREVSHEPNHAGLILSSIGGNVDKGRYSLRFPETVVVTPYSIDWSFAPSWGSQLVNNCQTARFYKPLTSVSHLIWENYIARVAFQGKPLKRTLGSTACYTSSL